MKTSPMHTVELDYELPEASIAQYPPPDRDGGRLLELDRGRITHRVVRDFPSCVPKGSLVVLNDTRVMRSRLFGVRESTRGKVELLLLDADDDKNVSALARAKRPLEVGERIRVGDAPLDVVARAPDGTLALRAASDVGRLMEEHGHVPLPPYVRRQDEASDRERYQTVFAKHLGSAAAPTAGLHLSDSLLSELRNRDVELGFVTLHVGIGTFRPVTAERLDDHLMHTERYFVGEELVAAVRRTRARGGRVVAVGTTVLRALESSAESDGDLRPGGAETALLIAPGYRFSVVDALLTNFHAPRSTLLALIYAFAGQRETQAAYAEAIEQKYRFLSYGDAMWLPRRSA